MREPMVELEDIIVSEPGVLLIIHWAKWTGE